MTNLHNNQFSSVPDFIMTALQIGDVQPCINYIDELIEAVKKDEVPHFIGVLRLYDIYNNTEVRHGREFSQYLDDQIQCLNQIHKE